MLGAIIGDIVGSVYEWNRIKTKDFEFFTSRCFFTDDSVCTAAVADILLHDLPPTETMQKWCQRYPDCSYGGMFGKWIYEDTPEPYDSYGNGAAMRVSPAAFLHRDDLDAALAASDTVTAITHNHPEGMKGARATTHAIWLAFQGKSPAAICRIITNEYGYDLTQTVDEIRLEYSFDETCQGTVPQAITCALESVSFEDAVRNAISLGGDSDTLAAIAGPIAEALHGIPKEYIEKTVTKYLVEADDIKTVIKEMYQSYNSSSE
ncbi:ADP-ribosylglycohydrolase [Candidatus Poribacteria bacterium]|nr:MAG: ADP-ribosylglycohydrolase [Candidatus Poribacteria bacterium]